MGNSAQMSFVRMTVAPPIALQRLYLHGFLPSPESCALDFSCRHQCRGKIEQHVRRQLGQSILRLPLPVAARH